MMDKLGIKATSQGALVYGAMAAYFAAFGALVAAWLRGKLSRPEQDGKGAKRQPEGPAEQTP
ncbi:MAG: hypothetical protein E4H48_04990, partial [Syntrophobacterales bacterium]